MQQKKTLWEKELETPPIFIFAYTITTLRVNTKIEHRKYTRL